MLPAGVEGPMLRPQWSERGEPQVPRLHNSAVPLGMTLPEIANLTGTIRARVRLSITDTAQSHVIQG
jgi:hypothetical protein